MSADVTARRLSVLVTRSGAPMLRLAVIDAAMRQAYDLVDGCSEREPTDEEVLDMFWDAIGDLRFSEGR